MVKKALPILITAVLLFACCGPDNRVREYKHIEKSSTAWKVFEGDLEKTTVHDTVNGGYGMFYVAEISGCEYIVGNGYMAHKGNCKFCEERNGNGNEVNNDKEEEETWTW